MAREGLPATIRTTALALCQLLIQAEQEALLPAFWTSLHPLTLSHQLGLFIGIRYERGLRLLLYFNDLLSTILGEEYTWRKCRSFNEARREIIQYLHKGPS